MNVDPIHTPLGAAVDGLERAAEKMASRESGEARLAEGVLSSLGQSRLRGFLAAAAATPAERQARVAELRAAVARGTYEVSIETLAGKLLGRGD